MSDKLKAKRIQIIEDLLALRSSHYNRFSSDYAALQRGIDMWLVKFGYNSPQDLHPWFKGIMVRGDAGMAKRAGSFPTDVPTLSLRITRNEVLFFDATYYYNSHDLKTVDQLEPCKVIQIASKTDQGDIRTHASFRGIAGGEKIADAHAFSVFTELLMR